MNQQGADLMAEVQCHCVSTVSRMATHKSKILSCRCARHEGMRWSGVQFFSVLTSEADGGGLSASRPGRFNTGCPFNRSLYTSPLLPAASFAL